MNYQLIYKVLMFSSICLVSCDRPRCDNANPIFEGNEPSSKKYKAELAKQLNAIDQTKLTYWLQKYEEQEGKEYLYFNIQGDDLCAILHLSMTHWDKLEKVREKKGAGRRGAKFTNLKFKVIQDSLSTQFIYTSYDSIID